MQRRVFWAVAFMIFGIVACKAATGPKADTPLAANGMDGGTPLATKPILYDDEQPVGKLVAFKDGDDMRAYTTAWQNELNPQPTFFKMPGDKDGGAPPPPPPTKGLSPAQPSPAPTTAPVAPAARPAPKAAGRAAQAGPPANAAAEGARKFSDDALSSAKDRDKAGGDESITNNQHAAVDEGDIVKLHGDFLIVLRRGRLFTISVGGDQIKQSKMLDAFGPDIDPRGSWYDEMVVDGDNIVVVGYSYQRGGTEVGLFKIDSAGGLTYRATYHLKSNDYYSARNYASRIVDGRLVFYTPLYITSGEPELTNHFPAVRRWRKNVQASDFVRTLVPTRLYHLENEFPQTAMAALHTVTTCDLRDPSFPCESLGIVGPMGRVFYVSPTNVYVWMQDYAQGHSDQPRKGGLLAKLPIGRTPAPPTAVRVAGMPTDQFSFEEDETGNLDVLVRAESNGDAMFASEHTAGATALLRVPLNMFSDTVLNASKKRYRVLPRPDGFAVQNRFVGSWLLYGSGQGYITGNSGKGQLFAVRYAHPEDPPTSLDLDQGIDRIEPMADDAVIVGSRGQDLVFTPIELGGTKEAHARRDYVRKNASQGELRSHGFFYKPGKKDREGMIGLPIRSEGTRGSAYLTEGSASVLFLQQRSLEFTELGSLRAAKLTTNHDGCRASCVDWYGNARPIFAKGRIFALMGYDLVEGRVEEAGRASHIVERNRLSFAPRGGPPADEFYGD